MLKKVVFRHQNRKVFEFPWKLLHQNTSFIEKVSVYPFFLDNVNKKLIVLKFDFCGFTFVQQLKNKSYDTYEMVFPCNVNIGIRTSCERFSKR